MPPQKHKQMKSFPADWEITKMMQVCSAFEQQWERCPSKLLVLLWLDTRPAHFVRDFKTSFAWRRTTQKHHYSDLQPQKMLSSMNFKNVPCIPGHALHVQGVQTNGLRSTSKQPGAKGGHRPADDTLSSAVFVPTSLCIGLCFFVLLDNCLGRNEGQLSPGRCVLSASRSAWPYLAAPLWNVLVWDSTDQHDSRKLCVLSRAGHGKNWAPKWPRKYFIPSVVKKMKVPSVQVGMYDFLQSTWHRDAQRLFPATSA